MLIAQYDTALCEDNSLIVAMAQTADQTKPRIRSTATTETQRDLAQTRGFAHGGPDQRDEPADQRLEQLFPHRGGEGDVRGTGLVYVLPCTAVYETAPSDEVRLVENGEILGPIRWTSRPVGLHGQGTSCYP